MTNKEAIHELEIMLKSCDYDEQFEALAYALKVLEQLNRLRFNIYALNELMKENEE